MSEPRPLRNIVVTYALKDEPEEWLEQCIRDGDWNGIMEYLDSEWPVSVEVVPRTT